MEGDKVIVSVTALEKDGDTYYCGEISEKPQYMLQAEYEQQMLRCAVEVNKMVAKKVFPNGAEARERMIEYIYKKSCEEM